MSAIFVWVGKEAENKTLLMAESYWPSCICIGEVVSDWPSCAVSAEFVTHVIQTAFALKLPYY